MEPNSFIDLVNKKTYAKTNVLDYYDGATELFAAEKVLFDELSVKIKGSKILDIGVGGGRTTKYLLPLASDYIGVDYVPEFIELVKKKFPNGHFAVGDARDLKEFEDKSFDFVIFAYNGIDFVSHEDRLRILTEIYRVLKNGGSFIFSSHNRNYEFMGRPYWLKGFRYNLTGIKHVLSYVFFLLKHLRLKRFEVSTKEYAIINDSDHRYSLLTYYISLATQIKQLEKIGFSAAKAYNENGVVVECDTKSFWIYYLTTK